MLVRNNYEECLTNLACSIRKYFELDYKHYIILALVVSSFPFVKIFNLSEIFIFMDNLIQLIVLIMIYRYFNTKIKTLLEFLKEKK